MPGFPVADIRNSLGPAFVGLLVSTTLFGLTIVQAWIYFWNYRNRDRHALKFFIGFLIVVDALHTILCSYAIYWYLILNFGNVVNLDYSVWALNFQIAISTILRSSVQFFYARRVYVVSQSIFFPIVIVVLIASETCLGFFFSAEEFTLKHFSRFHSLFWVTCIGTSVASSADILIAATMCYALYRRKTGFARTDSIIMTLMAYSINSGMLTSVLGTGMTISFAIAPSNLTWLAFFWPMGKCHAISLLAMLNSRHYVRKRSSADHTKNSFNYSSIRIDPPPVAYGSKFRESCVTISVHYSTLSDLEQSKSDHIVEPTLEVPQPDTSVIHSQSQILKSESIV